ELKRSLYALFSQFGRIVDIVALKTSKLRGQAWVVFSDVPAASNAVRQMQSFPFYDKPMRIQYAKTKSDCIAKAEGTYDKKARKLEDKVERNRRPEDNQQQPNGHQADANGAAVVRPAMPPGVMGQQQSVTEPNNILFVENLPYETNSMMLELLFKQYPGFREVRMVEAKPGIAFVEFEDDSQSSIAMQDLQGFKITAQNPMAISYAKK
ncbi:spliceosomal protein, partial [Genlisea aurea]